MFLQFVFAMLYYNHIILILIHFFRFVLSKTNVSPTTILVDFEIAAHQAIRALFQFDTEIRGCFYHLTQSTWRKIQQLGLTNLYKEDSDFRSFCGKLDALALLPLDRVKEGWIT